MQLCPRLRMEGTCQIAPQAAVWSYLGHTKITPHYLCRYRGSVETLNLVAVSFAPAVFEGFSTNNVSFLSMTAQRFSHCGKPTGGRGFSSSIRANDNTLNFDSVMLLVILLFYGVYQLCYEMDAEKTRKTQEIPIAVCPNQIQRPSPNPDPKIQPIPSKSSRPSVHPCYSASLYDTCVSILWLFVLKLLSITFSAFFTSFASESPHSSGTSESASA